MGLRSNLRYVRHLERKVREMETRQSEASGPVEANLPGKQAFTEFPSQASDVSISTKSPGGAIARNSDVSSTNLNLQQQQPSSTFAEELKCLSLEATAERHLGSTSGVSFAKLTQMVLRRLSPDKVDFVFANGHRNNTEAGMFNFNSPLELADHTLFERLNESISIHPSLFGNFPLADIVQPTDATTGLDLPSDETHVNRLVDFYFAHSHTLYPIIHRGDFLKNIQEFRESPQVSISPSPLFMFRMWMVLAIGSTAYSAISLTEESESRMYYNKALHYFEQAMCGDIVRTTALVSCRLMGREEVPADDSLAGCVGSDHATGLILIFQPTGPKLVTMICWNL